MQCGFHLFVALLPDFVPVFVGWIVPVCSPVIHQDGYKQQYYCAWKYRAEMKVQKCSLKSMRVSLYTT